MEQTNHLWVKSEMLSAASLQSLASTHLLTFVFKREDSRIGAEQPGQTFCSVSFSFAICPS